MFSKACSRVWPLYCQLKVLPLDILIQIEWGKTMFRYQAGTLPQVFNTYFSRPTHTHRTRFATNNNFEVVRLCSAKEKSLLKYIGPKVWLDIPSSIKMCSTVKSFVAMYRSYLLDNFNGIIN